MKSVHGIGTQSIDNLIKLCASNTELHVTQLDKSQKGKAQFDGIAILNKYYTRTEDRNTYHR